MDEFTKLRPEVVEHLGVIEARDYNRRLRTEALRKFKVWDEDGDESLDDELVDHLPKKEKNAYRKGRNPLEGLVGLNKPTITPAKITELSQTDK